MPLPSADLIQELLEAAQWAVTAHDGQIRRGSGNPYVVHPLRVAALVLGSGLEAESARIALLAAILHDTLEDTDLPAEQIKKRFGEAVASVVDELTQDKTLPKAERRQKMIDGCGKYSLEAKVVKLADRWDNMSEMKDLGPQFVRRYCEEAERMVAAMRGTWPRAESSIEELISDARRSD